MNQYEAPGPVARIDLQAIRHNAQQVRVLRPQARLLAVVKANAYGHGMVEVAGALASVADGFAVARIGEAIALRRSGTHKPVVVLGLPMNATATQVCLEYDIDIQVFSRAQFEYLQTQGYIGQRQRLWLKVDTGMNRIGLSVAECKALCPTLNSLTHTRELILMSHLSSAEEVQNGKTSHQYQQLRQLLRALECSGSLLNSAGVVAWPDLQDDWVRPGLMLYGVNPLDPPYVERVQLLPAMQLSAPVIDIKAVQKGDSVGYNEAFRATRDSRIAILGIGYADGYPQTPSGTPVWLNGVQVPTVGRVSMDLMAVEISDCPACRVGDRAILWGAELPVKQVATAAQLIPYQLLTAVSPRVQRVYG